MRQQHDRIFTIRELCSGGLVIAGALALGLAIAWLIIQSDKPDLSPTHPQALVSASDSVG